MSEPAPLSLIELARIWRWHRHMVAFYGIAIALLALAGALMLMFGGQTWVRRAALALLVLLLVAATMIEFRERCPRCGLRLGSHGRLCLPEQCPGCGVFFQPPPPA